MMKIRFSIPKLPILLWLIISFALIFRLLYLFAIVGPSSFPLNIDSIEHHLIAHNLVGGQGYSIYGLPTANRAPFLTYLMALIYFILGEHFVLVRLVIIVMSLLLVWAIYQLSIMIFTHKVGLWAAFLAAIYPHFIFYSARIYTEIPFTLWSILAVIFLIKYFQTQRFFPLILSGIFFALAVLTRPVGLFLFIFIIFLILFRQPRWDNVKHVVVLAMAMIILILPWTIRNYVVFGKFIPVTTQGSLVLWVSNNHYIAHHPYYKGQNALYQRLPGASNLITSDETKRAEYAFRYFKDFVITYPADIPRLMWNKTYGFWSSTFFTGSSKRWIYEYSYLSIFIFSVLGMLLTIRFANKAIIFLWLILFSHFIPALIFWAGARMRLPAEPALIIFSALTLDQINIWIKQKWHR